MSNKYFLGIDIGGTKCAVIAARENMEVLAKESFPTETRKGPDHALGLLLTKAEEIVEKLGISDLVATGISCGGPLDSRKGIIQSPPNLPGWDNIEIVRLFREKFTVPAYLQNDANACALAEWQYGAGKGTSNMVFLTFGSGMGGGIIADGRLYSGTNDLAGEVGHIRLAEDGPEGYGKKGSFEGFCSGNGIARTARKIISDKISRGEKVGLLEIIPDLENLSTKDLAQAAYRGDETALEIFRQTGEYLGRGLSLLIDILNPQMIVIGSIYARCTDLLEPYCLEVIKREALEPAAKVCRIVPAALGDEVGDYAAISVAVTGNSK